MVNNSIKNTECGPIPEDWSVKKIGEFTYTTAGGTPSTKVPAYWGGLIKWMNSGELNFRRIYDVEGRITEEGLRNSSTHLIPPNCVLIGLAGQGKTRGTVAINYVELCTNQSIAAIFPSDSHIPEFLYQSLYKRYNELRELSSGGGGRGGLNLKIINNLPCPIPSIEEQKEIAAVLFDLDTYISSLIKLIEKKKNIKIGIMQELLTGKKRLPGFTKPWNIVELGSLALDMADGPFGSNLKVEHYTKSKEVRIVQLSNIGDDGWKDENVKYTTFEHSKKISRSIVHPGNVIIAKMMPAGRAILCPNHELGYVLSSDAVKVVIDSSKALPQYVVYATKSKHFQSQIADQIQGSTRARTSITKLRKNTIFLPEIDEQKAIVVFLSDMDQEIVSLNNKLSKYKDIKQGMMQKLLTGEIRLI